MLVGNAQDLRHGCGMSVQVHRYDRFGFGGDGLAQRIGIHAKCMRIDLNENWGQSKECNDFGGCDVGEGRRNHFIAGLQPQRHHGDLQGIRSVGARDYMRYAQITGQFFSKLLHRFTVDEGRTFQHL